MYIDPIVHIKQGLMLKTSDRFSSAIDTILGTSAFNYCEVHQLEYTHTEKTFNRWFFQFSHSNGDEIFVKYCKFHAYELAMLGNVFRIASLSRLCCDAKYWWLLEPVTIVNNLFGFSMMIESFISLIHHRMLHTNLASAWDFITIQFPNETK